jgi:hypothetical protein
MIANKKSKLNKWIITLQKVRFLQYITLLDIYR